MYYPGYPSRFCLVATGSLRKLGNLQIRASQCTSSARVLTGTKSVLTCVKKMLTDFLSKFRFPIQQLYRQIIGLINLVVGCTARPWGRYGRGMRSAPFGVLVTLKDGCAQRTRGKNPIETILYVIHQDDDDEGPKFKDILCDFLKKSMDVLCIWDCCKLWIRTAEVSTARTSYLAACQKAPQIKKVREHYSPYGHLHWVLKGCFCCRWCLLLLSNLIHITYSLQLSGEKIVFHRKSNLRFFPL